MRTLVRLLLAGGIATICGIILWLLGTTARGFSVYHPRDVVLPAALVGLFGMMGAELALAVRQRDAKLSPGGISGRWAIGSLVLAAICGALVVVVARAGLRLDLTVWGVVLVLALALAGYALAGGALIGSQRGLSAWLGALAGVGLGALWGVALALGFGVASAVGFHNPCPPYGYCFPLNRWNGLRAMLLIAPPYGVAAGVVLAIAVGLALLILSHRDGETGA